ncbi:hypothetical protein FHL15_000553 [Xylaria flabelliformis]|uniref:Uncharacterized protein n=1 Tax=Xylaria flabelliformis TaxID=2512241 RepID=A0A553IE55_9PEZI|nr:hypothetical protein FHL15_000553 [Xylaria flabelliformis]
MADEGSWWSYHRGKWNATKLILRCSSFVFGIIIIGLSVNNGVRVRNWVEYEDYFRIDWWFTLPVTLLSIVVDCAELISIFLRKRNPGIPPGWHIGIELVLLGGNIVALVFIASLIPPDAGFAYGAQAPLSLRPFQIASVSFLGIFTVVRFILFVIACVDTHRYHTAAQVEAIVQALRRTNIDDARTAAIIHNLSYPTNHIDYRQPASSNEFPYTMRPTQDLSDESTLYRELPDNQKFLVSELPPRMYKPT